MTKDVSKTQIDRLGERLRKGDISEVDLRLLDTYRRSFTEAYEAVVGTIRKELSLEPTGRPAKSTTSISEKLRRESIRLTQIQDIAGCRLIVADIAAQENAIEALTSLFEHTNIIDRRQRPSHGYRAVHVVVNHHGKLIEIQVRTAIQHLWAELSEKISDFLGIAVKYGGGDAKTTKLLMTTSLAITKEEDLEAELSHLLSQNELTDTKKKALAEVRDELGTVRRDFFKAVRNSIQHLEETKGDEGK